MPSMRAYRFLPARLAAQYFFIRSLTAFRAAADIRRRFRRGLSIVAAGSGDTSIWALTRDARVSSGTYFLRAAISRISGSVDQSAVRVDAAQGYAGRREADVVIASLRASTCARAASRGVRD